MLSLEDGQPFSIGKLAGYNKQFYEGLVSSARFRPNPSKSDIMCAGDSVSAI